MNDDPAKSRLSAEAVAEPFSYDELRALFLRPYRAIDVVLAQRDRWIATVVDGTNLWILLVLMAISSMIYAVPYGLVLGLDQYWKVAALFGGSVMICFPSLHVFSAFINLRIHLAQQLALALLVTSVAAIFSFGFFPILWFLDATMTGEAADITVHVLSVFLLLTALCAAIVQLIRCLLRDRRLRLGGSFWFWIMILLWQGLLIFITCRMGIFLDLI